MATLQETVYMVQPKGFVDETKPRFVCKVQKSLYGLKQAAREWYNKLRSTLLSQNFRNSKADSSLFFYINGNQVVLVLIYVDDIIITGNNNTLIQRFIHQLDSAFALKDLGPLNFFLGIEVHRDINGLYLTQRKYILSLLKKLGFDNLKSAPTPAVHGKYLSASYGQFNSIQECNWRFTIFDTYSIA